VKVVTILGTRPEIIRLSALIPRLDALCEHTLVHTEQNADPSLSEIFFRELGIRRPDRSLEVDGRTFGARIGQIITRSEEVLRSVRPDRLLVLGDTDSGLAALVAKRLGIEVHHMEAGNRCYDDRTPEEVNRRVIDHSSDVLLPYTERSRANLLREGVAPERIIVTGNPIYEVMQVAAPAIEASEVVTGLGLTPSGYVLATVHRQENLDDVGRLRALVASLALVGETLDLPVVCSAHPRLRDRLAVHCVDVDTERLRLEGPFGFFDFVRLERDARCVLTDSGTVQEECCILGVPAVTLRDATERPETVECGSNIVAGVEPAEVLRCTRTMLAREPSWQPPPEYLAPAVSEVVARILLKR
jgi:UDP-N-acetylglucosamine 2-epimerase (non-hydrolysing)